MKRLIVVFVVVAIPFCVFAQNWTAEQQAVLNQVKKSWDAWVKSVNEKNLDIWLNACQPTDDFAGWWVSEGHLSTLEAWKRGFPEWVAGNKKTYWENLQPLSIKIYDNTALIYFYVVWHEEDINGKVTNVEDKRLEVLRKMDGVWRWTGGMVQNKEISLVIKQEN